jgi:hypothetical protein
LCWVSFRQALALDLGRPEPGSSYSCLPA